MDLELRRRVAEEAVRFLFTPVMLAVGLIVAIVLCTTGISEPTRLLPPALFVVLCLGVPRLNRQKRWLASAAMFSGALTVAIMTAVLLNSVHAPGNSLSVILLLLVMTLFGARWGLVAALLVTLAGAGWLLLDHAGLAIGTVYPSSVTAFSLNTGILLAALFFLHAPHRLLSDALKTARDERAQAEAARSAEAASELAFHAVFDQASVAMALLGPDGRMSQLNQRAQQLLGQTEQSLVGLSLASAPLWDAAQRQLLTHAVTLAASGHGSRHELSLPRSDARPGIYQLAISPFHNTSGGVGHVIVELVDVNDLVETRAMLAQARRLEALGKLSGGVAHDINNMLGAILGACELVRIAHRSGKTQRVEDTVEIIQSSVVRAASLTKQLLAFGRNDRWNSEQLDVGRLLQEVVRLLDRTLHKNIDLVLAPSEKPCYVRADAAALEHGLLNLALNAQDAMPDGGTLTIACRTLVLDELACRALCSEIAPGPAVVLTVTDTGMGMSSEVRDRIFEPFFTTKPFGEGTGLGLSAVHGTVTGHHGAIAVQSCEGIGTRFEIYLPQAQVQQIANDNVAPVLLVQPVLNARVLLADDEPLARTTISAMLESLGCEVQSVASGTELIDALNEGASPDVVVTDLAMPGLSGVRLVQTLESMRPDSPLLLVTGFTGDDVSSVCPARMSRRLLRKPFLRVELLLALQETLLASRRAALRPDAVAQRG